MGSGVVVYARRTDRGGGMAMKAIVVEDKTELVDRLSDRLMRLGHEVAGVAPTAAHLAALLEDHQPDIVFIDLDLGDRQDGIGVATLLEAGGALPVVFVVQTYEESAEVEESRTVECSARLMRPFTADDLEQAIERAVRRANEAEHPTF
jgi:AmiR/NasT family two-component response regulator